jgi:hypothetical protein
LRRRSESRKSSSKSLTLSADLWTSDYPHERDQRDFSHDIPNLINRKDASDELNRKIFWDNPPALLPAPESAGGKKRRAVAGGPTKPPNRHGEFTLTVI